MSDNVVVIFMALTGQEHIFKIYFLINEKVSLTSQPKDLTRRHKDLTRRHKDLTSQHKLPYAHMHELTNQVSIYH